MLSLICQQPKGNGVFRDAMQEIYDIDGNRASVDTDRGDQSLEAKEVADPTPA